ncbi:hypothetical protein [Brevibacillus agri]|uniref:hypothetical protein n=3 Tax=Brevibacillus agri TaxID=51101 RepID=UPI003D255608|nr:hypothetical protein [Brevibacillus agri]
MYFFWFFERVGEVGPCGRTLGFCALYCVGEKVVGQHAASIGMGDRGVVTKMRKKEFVIRYVPSGNEYSPQQIKQLEQKEDALILYIIHQLLFQDTPKQEG